MATIDNVVHIVRLNGGRVVGKTRLQKTAYLLEALGLGFDLEFEYHHYGPYSEQLADLAEDARALGYIGVDWNRSSEGAEYAVFFDQNVNIDPDRSELDERRRVALQVLRRYSAVELELAATADFLERRGYREHAWSETARRKASKISAERLDRSRLLLNELRQIGCE